MAPSTVPKQIWYKLGPKGLSPQAREWTESCIQGNSDYRVEFMTDSSGDAFVEKTFSSRPDLVKNYLELSIPILKADILRYLLLYAEGGIWLDLDISCEDIPIDNWIPSEYKHDAGLIVGWEFDMGWGDAFIRQFTTWTIMARPGQPHIWMVVEDCLRTLAEKTAEHNISMGNLTIDMVGDIVDVTGPRRMTQSIYKSLEKSLNGTIDHPSIQNLLQPKLIGDVLILPGYSFASVSNKYGDIEGLGPPLVKHHYAGSWKNKDGGEATSLTT